MTVPKECAQYGYNTRPAQGTAFGPQILYDQLVKSAGGVEEAEVLYGFDQTIAKAILNNEDLSRFIQFEAFAGVQLSRHDMGNSAKMQVVIKFALDNFTGPAGQIMSALMSFAAITHFKEKIKRIKLQVLVLSRFRMIGVRMEVLSALTKWRKDLNRDCTYYDLWDWAANIGTEWGAVKVTMNPERPATCKPFATLSPNLYPMKEWVPVIKSYIDARVEFEKEQRGSKKHDQQKTSKKSFADGSVKIQEPAPENTKAVVGLGALTVLKTVVLGGL